MEELRQRSVVGSGLPPAKVLVVEDDMRLRRALARCLAMRGDHVEQAAHGREALSKLQRMHFDAMVLDLHMAPMSGHDLLREITPRLRELTVIVLSGHVDVPQTVELMRLGVQDVVTKPASANTVYDTLHSAMEATRCSLRGVQRLLGCSRSMEAIRQQVARVARFHELSVLVLGETGTGKDVIAHAIHDSAFPDEPFVAINCAAVPETLFESELFGHEAGAFTGARGTHVGHFERAGHGTIFLDEIGEMPPALQSKLLRTLEERTFRRIGSTASEIPLRARIIAATNRPLLREDGTHAIRSDLYYRLTGFSILSPPLRNRKEDIPQLAKHFLTEFRRRYPIVIGRTIEDRGMTRLLEHHWPGNVRELRHVVEQALIESAEPVVSAELIGHAMDAGAATPPSTTTLPAGSVVDADAPAALPELERQMILRSYEECGRNVSRTARRLGIPRSTLRDRLRRLGAR